MKKIYLDRFFSFLANNTGIQFDDYCDISPGCDLIGISFYNNDWINHSLVVKSLLPKTKKLLINVSEPTPGSRGDFMSFLKEWDIPDVYMFSDAVLNSISPANFATVVSWFIGPINFYASEPWAIDRMNQLVQSYSKPYYFDCLLGSRRTNRDIIEFNYKKSAIQDKIIFSYYRDRNDLSQGIWDSDIANDLSKLVDQNFRSYCIPVSVYNQSYYSIVAETTFANSYNQYTEKVAKPIIGRRPFVAFNGQYYLKNLRSLGFQTFGSVINEDYDNIADIETRLFAAWQQVEKLCSLNPVEVLEQLKPILDHNFNHFINTDWHSAIRAHFD